MPARGGGVAFPEFIDATAYYFPPTLGLGFDPGTGDYIHTLLTTNATRFDWFVPTSKSLMPTSQENIFPLLGELVRVDSVLEFRARHTQISYVVNDNFTLMNMAGGSYNNEGNPPGYQNSIAIMNGGGVASLGLGLECVLPHGLAPVEFPADGNARNNPFGRHSIVIRNNVNPFVTPAGAYDYVGVNLDGGEAFAYPPAHFSPPNYTYLGNSVSSLAITSSVTDPADLEFVSSFRWRLASTSTPSMGVTSYNSDAIGDASKWTWAPVGDVTSGEMRWRSSVRMVHRYRPRTPVGYARALKSRVFDLGSPADVPSPDVSTRKLIADLIWDYIIRVRETSAETSSQNIALRDAEYFWRGVAGGYGLLIFDTFRLADFFDPVNTAGNISVPVSTPLYNFIKTIQLEIGMKRSVTLDDAAIAALFYNGEAGYPLPGTDAESLPTTTRATLNGYRLGLRTATFFEIDDALLQFQQILGGMFPVITVMDLIEEFAPAGLGLSTTSTDRAPRSTPGVQALDAYVDTLEEARLGQRYFLRPEDGAPAAVFTLDYQPGPIQSSNGGGGNQSFSVTGGPVAKAAPGDIIRGTITFVATGDNFTSVRVEGPVEQTLTGRLWVEIDGHFRHIRAGETLDLAALVADGVEAVTIGGLDGLDLEGSLFDFHFTTAGGGQTFFGQTVYYRAEERSSDFARSDSDNNNLSDQWERDHFGALGRAAPMADSDGDGVPEIAEMVSGSHPGDPNSVPLLKLGALDADEWLVSLPVRPGLEFALSPQWSADLTDWFPLEIWPEYDEDQAGAPTGTYLARYRIPRNGANKLFFRPGYRVTSFGGGGG